MERDIKLEGNLMKILDNGTHLIAEDGKVLKMKSSEEIFDSTEVFLGPFDNVDNWEEVDFVEEDNQINDIL